MSGRPQLKRMLQAMERGRPIPQDVATWFTTAVAEFEANGNDLAETLDIRVTRQHRQARNAHLRAAGRMLGDGIPATQRATRIRRAAEMLQAFIEDPALVEERYAGRWEFSVFQAILCAPLPSQSTLRQLLT